MGRLTSRNVIITGAAGGIGLATGKLFLAPDVNPEVAENLLPRIPT